MNFISLFEVDNNDWLVSKHGIRANTAKSTMQMIG
jgi:hypothetical protein